MVSGDGRLKECFERENVRGELVDLFGRVSDKTVCSKVFLQNRNQVMILKSDFVVRGDCPGMNSWIFPFTPTHGFVVVVELLSHV